MKHLKPNEAHEFLQKNPQAVMIDCRSEVEYLYVGHPLPSHHVAWNDGPDWDINPHFVGQVKKVTQTFSRDAASAGPVMPPLHPAAQTEPPRIS